MSEMKQIASNAEWQLFKDEKGNFFAKCVRTNETKQIAELAVQIREMKSLIALIEGRGVKLE